MTKEEIKEFRKQFWSKNLKKFITEISFEDGFDFKFGQMMDKFGEVLLKQNSKVNTNLLKGNERLKKAGKEATELIAHLKDQYGFNEEEESSQNKIMSVFDYEGDF